MDRMTAKMSHFREICPLDRNKIKCYHEFRSEKGIEKDAVRERHQRGAAAGCKRPLLEPEPVTTLEPPTDM